MTDTEPSHPRMMRAVAWFVLSLLSACVVFAAPVSLDGIEPAGDENVSATYSADASPVGHDFVPFGGLAVSQRPLLGFGLHITAPSRPRAVHSRSRLLRYAPKTSPPHTT